MLTIIDSNIIRQELLDLGFIQVTNPRDEQLALPSLKFLTDLYNSIDRTFYQTQSNDCDDYALKFVSKADDAIALTKQNCGHCILMCNIELASGSDLNGIKGPGAHSTIITKTNHDNEWKFFEPQNGNISSFKDNINNILSYDFVLL